jgi:hypothetical protein
MESGKRWKFRGGGGGRQGLGGELVECLVRKRLLHVARTSFGSPVVILCCVRGEDAGVGSGGRVCFVGFFEGHGGGGSGVYCRLL